MEVCLTALNWERECKSPTVPQQWTPLWLPSNNAIELFSRRRLGVEKSLKTSLQLVKCRILSM